MGIEFPLLEFGGVVKNGSWYKAGNLCVARLNVMCAGFMTEGGVSAATHKGRISRGDGL
jgi:hypothetical protein